MPKVQVFNMQGTEVGEIELSESVFGITPNIHVLHSAVVSQLAGARRGTQSALLRGEVRGGGRKPFRQKRNRSCTFRQYTLSIVERRWGSICTQTSQVRL